MDFIQQIATDLAILIAPLGVYIEWKISRETRVLEEKLDNLDKKIDQRFDINENDLTVVATEVRRDIKFHKENYERLITRVDAWENYLRTTNKNFQ